MSDRSSDRALPIMVMYVVFPTIGEGRLALVS